MPAAAPQKKTVSLRPLPHAPSPLPHTSTSPPAAGLTTRDTKSETFAAPQLARPPGESQTSSSPGAQPRGPPHPASPPPPPAAALPHRASPPPPPDAASPPPYTPPPTRPRTPTPGLAPSSPGRGPAALGLAPSPRGLAPTSSARHAAEPTIALTVSQSGLRTAPTARTERACSAAGAVRRRERERRRLPALRPHQTRRPFSSVSAN